MGNNLMVALTPNNYKRYLLFVSMEEIEDIEEGDPCLESIALNDGESGASGTMNVDRSNIPRARLPTDLPNRR